MVAENLTNFATSSIAGTALTSTGLSVTLTGGTGTNFPASSFAVTIDAEVLWITSRSTDTLTIGIRGFDGTSAVSHSIGATVLLGPIGYNFRHLWENTADTYHPDVPITQSQLSATGLATGGASTYDTEFESAGSWTLYPSSPPSGSSFAINSLMRSHLLLNRYGANDNALYTAYSTFSPSGAFTVTCKVSDAINIAQNGTQSVETHLFLCDQSNPTSSSDTGNRFRLDIVTTALTTTFTSNNSTQNMILNTDRYIRCSVDVNGTWYPQSPLVPIAYAQPVYLRINYDGSGNWNAYVGDGYTYTLIVNHQNFTINLQSIGFQFYAGYSSPYYVSHTSAIDFLHVVLGSQLPAYGS